MSRFFQNFYHGCRSVTFVSWWYPDGIGISVGTWTRPKRSGVFASVWYVIRPVACPRDTSTSWGFLACLALVRWASWTYPQSLSREWQGASSRRSAQPSSQWMLPWTNGLSALLQESNPFSDSSPHSLRCSCWNHLLARHTTYRFLNQSLLILRISQWRRENLGWTSKIMVIFQAWAHSLSSSLNSLNTWIRPHHRQSLI